MTTEQAAKLSDEDFARAYYTAQIEGVGHNVNDAVRMLEERLASCKILIRALNEIAKRGQYSGVVPCPTDHDYYVAPMQAIAREALAAYKEGE